MAVKSFVGRAVFLVVASHLHLGLVFAQGYDEFNRAQHDSLIQQFQEGNFRETIFTIESKLSQRVSIGYRVSLMELLARCYSAQRDYRRAETIMVELVEMLPSYRFDSLTMGDDFLSFIVDVARYKVQQRRFDVVKKKDAVKSFLKLLRRRP